jgi:hypothetical protein
MIRIGLYIALSLTWVPVDPIKKGDLKMSQKVGLRVTFALAFPFVFAAAAFAMDGARAIVPGIDSIARIQAIGTPEVRLQRWQNATQKFVREHPGLSDEQERAVSDLMDLARDDMFLEDSLTPEARTLMIEIFSRLEKVLTYAEYKDLSRGFGTLQAWFLKNEVPVDTTIGGGATCNCSADSDCATGYHCGHPGCTTGAGSLSNGVCRAN